jgi:GNAT superfamily N-acetyltransferase
MWEVVEVEEGSDTLRGVIELANGPAKQTLGFLPDECFAERARKGTLLALLDKGRVLGHLLYDLPGYDVKIIQLCAAPDARRKGVARHLVEALIERRSDRRRIVLACRRDYEANKVWRALEFSPRDSRPGRSKEGHMLTIWVLDFGQPSLFDEFQDERPTAALDHNVFLDLHADSTKRPPSKESLYLLDDWIGEYIELCVTDEIFHEIDRHDVADERAAEQKAALQYRNLSKPTHRWSELVADVAGLAPRAGVSDHRHVARASVAGAKYLVSRDGNLLEAADRIETVLGLRVLPPEELIVRLDRLRSDSSYRPAALQGTELTQSSPTYRLHGSLTAALLNHGDGERKSEFESRLRPMLADRRNYDVQVIQATDGKIVAGFSRRLSGTELVVDLIRVAPGSVGGNVIARQLLFSQRRHAADNGLSSVRIVDPHMSRDVREALKFEHFRSDQDDWTCQVRIGLFTPEEPAFEGMDREDALAFESAHWPARILGAGVENFLIPIRIPFAEELIDPRLAEQSLLPRQLALGLSREHVYYRSTQNARGIGKGARILWYVTGRSPSHQEGAIRAISRLAEVIVGKPRSLHARFERFGVYSLEQVLPLTDRNGEVMALRFVDTEVLERPVSFKSLKSLWDDHGERFFAPQSPLAISERMFCLIYKQSSRYER